MKSKKELITFLWELSVNNPEATELRHSDSFIKNQYWHDSEWIYVKDIEIAFKYINKELGQLNSVNTDKIVSVALGLHSVNELSNNELIIEEFSNVMKSISGLSNS